MLKSSPNDKGTSEMDMDNLTHLMLTKKTLCVTKKRLYALEILDFA